MCEFEQMLHLLAADAVGTLARELRICARSRLARTCKAMTSKVLPPDLRCELARACCSALAERWLNAGGRRFLQCEREVLKRLSQIVYAKHRDQAGVPARGVVRSLVFDLIRCGINCGFCFHGSRTILHLAAEEGDEELVHVMLHGANCRKVASIRDEYGMSALTHACAKSSRFATVLAECFTWPEDPRERFTPLYMACRHWNEASSSSPASVAAEHHRRRQLCLLVLQHQPNTASRRCESRFPLHDAGCAEAVALLLSAGADAAVHTPDDTYPVACETPLHSLACNLRRLSRRHGGSAGETEASAGVAAAELLLRARAHVDAVRSDGFTALMLAAREGLPDLVRVLVVDGRATPGVVRVEAKIEKGQQVLYDMTALTHAAVSGHAACVRVLLQSSSTDTWMANTDTDRHGTEADTDRCGTEPPTRCDGRQWYKAPTLPPKVVQVRYRSRGPDVYGALLLAAECGRGEVVEALVVEGRADLQGLDDNGRRVLAAAEEAGCEGVQRWLQCV